MNTKKHKKRTAPQKKVPQTFGEMLLRSTDKTGGILSARRRPWQIYLCAFGLPFVILFFIWLFNGVIFGSRMILAHDQWHQYFPFFLDLQRKLKGGGSLFYSWTNGMGTNYLSMFAYYLASPMNFVAALLPQSMALGFYTFTVMVKISLAGLFCAIFLRKLFDRSDFSVVFFSLMYAFCAFICGYYWNAIWLDTVALLPLAALGTIALLRDGKFILYTSMLALSVLCSYYVGLFTCIFILLLFICYNICYWDDFSGFGVRLARIAFFTVLGLGMTALLSVPAFLGLRATSSAVNKFPKDFAINMSSDKSVAGVIDGVRKTVAQLGTGILPTSMEGLPNVACGTATAMLAAAYFTTKKTSLREKLCCAFLLLFFTASFIFRQLDYIWHGFHFPNMLPYRFSFLFSFVLLFMAYRTYTQLDRWRWYYCIALIPFALLLLFCVFTVQESAVVWLLTTLIVAIMLCALFLLGKKKLTKNLVTVLLCLLLLTEALIGAIRGAQQVGFSDASGYPTAKENVSQLVDEMKALEADTVDLWRAETSQTNTLNDNALNGYNGISTFSSAANSGVSLFLKTIGLAASVAGNRYAYVETVPLTSTLLGLKYMIDRNALTYDRPFFEEVGTSGNVKLLKNTAYLPMGFMVSDAVLEYDATVRDGSARTDNINYLYRLLSGSHEDLITTVSGVQQTADENVSVRKASEYRYTITRSSDTSSSDKAHFTYTLRSDCHFCVFTSAKDLNSISVNVNGGNEISYNTKYGCLHDFGNLKEGDKVMLSISAKKANQEGTLTVYAGSFDDEKFNALYDSLSRQTMLATEIGDTDIAGEILVKEDGICFFSIPYDKGWTATVDGKTAPTLSVFGAFTGIRLDAGSHTVALHYETPGFAVGRTVSYVCLAVFLLLVVISLVRRVFTRPMAQVDMKMLGKPAPAAPDDAEEIPEAPAARPSEETPIDEPSLAPEETPAECGPDALDADATQVVPTAEVAQAAQDDAFDALLGDVDALLHIVDGEDADAALPEAMFDEEIPDAPTPSAGVQDDNFHLFDDGIPTDLIDADAPTSGMPELFDSEETARRLNGNNSNDGEN